MTPITISIYVCIAVMALLAYFEPWFRFILYIGAEWIYLTVRKAPLYLKLRWEIYWIKRDKDRYLKMAQEILHEIEQQGTEVHSEHPSE